MIKVLVFCLVITSTLKQNNCKPLKRQGIENTSPRNIEEETKGPKIPKNSVEEKTKSKDEVKKITAAITTNISRNITEDVKDIGNTDEVLKAETLHETTQSVNSPKKLYTLATMNEAAYNKTAQLIRMVNHADIVPHRDESSKSNQADNLKAPSRQFRRFNKRRPRVKPRHDVLDVLRQLNSIVFNYQPVYLMRPLEDDDVTREDERKYRISNYDVLEMYIKNRRLKNNRNSKNGRGFPKRRNKMNIVQRGEGHHFYDIIEEDNDEDSDDGKAFYNARNDESIARAAADEGYDWADARHDSWPQQSREDEGGLREDSQKLDIDEEDSHKGKVKSILKNNWDYNNAERIFVQMRNKEERKTSHVKSNDWADSKIEENFSQERQEDKIFAEKGNNSNVKSKKEHESIKNDKTGKISTYNQFKEEGLSEERTSVAKEQYSSGTKYNKNTKENLKTQINYQGQQKRSAGSNDLDDKPRRFENDALDKSKPKNRNAPSVKSGKDKINDKAETYDEPDGPEKLDRENWSDKNRDRDRDIERDRDIDRDRIRDGNNDRDKDNDRDRDRDRDLPKASKKSDASFKSRSELKNEKIYKTGKETENKDDDDLKNYKDDYNADGLKSNTKKKEVYNDYKDSYDYGSNRDKKQSNKKTKDEYRNIKETDNKDYYNDRDKKKDSNDWTNKEKKTKKADDNDDHYDRQRVESKSKNNERTQKGHQDYDMLNDKTNDYKDVSKDKSQKSEVNSEKRNIWDRHANNDWDKVGVNNWGDKKAETTRRTTKENINYDFNEPVDTKKRYSDEVVKTSESKANKRQNNKPIKQNDDWDRPLKKVKFERQDNKYDIGRPKKIVNRGGYNSNRGKDRSSNSFPSYGHTPFIYTGGKSVYEEK